MTKARHLYSEWTLAWIWVLGITAGFGVALGAPEALRAYRWMGSLAAALAVVLAQLIKRWGRRPVPRASSETGGSEEDPRA